MITVSVGIAVCRFEQIFPCLLIIVSYMQPYATNLQPLMWVATMYTQVYFFHYHAEHGNENWQVLPEKEAKPQSWFPRLQPGKEKKWDLG
ncbi:hypothetical protein QUB80_31830 [Chlorogloeopsis sp. ULAP01]|uniref:hypothetical protein n=1 Tax=Chlorogloeopsis sp. ULAP01 TaxID=3056483 RepID=UPI0025AB0EBE|nr:hypothetical protein [Chlorogloeopsis sp. ULAP01]MDM9385246.1 hypothetical protein [Chlorogloeopsis sp. ULAP01]